MSIDNDTMDERVMATVRTAGPIRFAALCRELGVDPQEFATAPAWRAVDRSLQRLRKRGALVCAGTLWRTAKARP